MAEYSVVYSTTYTAATDILVIRAPQFVASTVDEGMPISVAAAAGHSPWVAPPDILRLQSVVVTNETTASTDTLPISIYFATTFPGDGTAQTPVAREPTGSAYAGSVTAKPTTASTKSPVMPLVRETLTVQKDFRWERRLGDHVSDGTIRSHGGIIAIRLDGAPSGTVTLTTTAVFTTG